MRLAIILTILITTVLAAGIGWAASLNVDSDHLTTINIDQAAEVPTPTPTPTPVPIPMTLYLDGSTTPGRLLSSTPGAAGDVTIGGLLGPPAIRYAISTPAGIVGTASNDSDWTLTLVSKGGVLTVLLENLLSNLVITVYWQDGGSSCTAPTPGQIFAQGANFQLIGSLVDDQGFAITVPRITSGTVSRTFDANDRLCMQMHNTLTVTGFSYRTGVVSTSGITGVMSNLQGPVYAP